MKSRIIKFRVWDTQNKEYSNWTNRDPFFSVSHGQLFFWERTRKEDGSYGGDIILEDNKDRFILQQFTGLVDKNRNEIYEGDILKTDGDLGHVFFTCGCFLLDGEGFLGDLVTSNEPDVIKDSEIVGNINENPDYWKEPIEQI